MENNLVSLNIGADVITPIVEKHIKDAVLESMGGKDVIIEKVIDQIIRQRVNKEGKVDSYSSENKYLWIDIILTKKIEDAVKKELEDLMSQSALKIKNALVSRLKTDKGAMVVADALLEGLAGTFKNSWTSKLDIKIEPNK